MLLAVLKFTRKVYETSPIRQHVVQRVAPTVEDYRTDDSLKEFIKNGCGCVYHPLGTAAMMPREDSGVVDPELRVYGTSNVRVVCFNVKLRRCHSVELIRPRIPILGRRVHPSLGKHGELVSIRNDLIVRHHSNSRPTPKLLYMPSQRKYVLNARRKPYAVVTCVLHAGDLVQAADIIKEHYRKTPAFS